ncbi:MAG TPA: phosphate signaling complex protein PhoU [Planctomycetota bacterium]|nr:phosphate signaling complex protein PhoU [Planctomycetota bacterium]
MSKQFDAELKKLKTKIMEMGAIAQSMFETAMRALVTREPALVAEIDALEARVDRFQVEIDEDAIRLMAVYGPVAMDLRFVLMVARINTELERIGDQAVNMCENVSLLVSEPELKKLVDLPRMAEVAARMLQISLEAFRDGAVERARDVIANDGEVDALNDLIFRELLTYMLSDPRNITRSVALLLTARALERIADHATNIAEEVIFMVKGEDVRHPEAREV